MRKIVFIFLSMSCCFPCFGHTYIVGQNGLKDFTTIQAAINAATDGDQIEVAPGTYHEAINFIGKAIRLYSRSGPTVTTIDANGITGTYHVVQCVNGEDADTILEGFTITGGNASSSWLENDGGGMCNWKSSPTVNNCIFISNTAAQNGGGIYNYSGSSIITNCTFIGNSAGISGGGIYNDNSSTTITDCTFSGNSADTYGGGMANDFSSSTVTNCTFISNSSSYDGGGMSINKSNMYVIDCAFLENTAYNNGGGMVNTGNSIPNIIDCTFSSNSADWIGGGMFNYKSSPNVNNCNFVENIAYKNGGGMYNYESSPNVNNSTFKSNSAGSLGGGMCNWISNPTVTSCTFKSNSADSLGGGMYNYTSSPKVTNCTFISNSANYVGGGMGNFNSSSPKLTNCTFSNNSAGWYGGGINNDTGSPIATNCILWGDTPDEINNSSSTPTVTYSDIQGGYTGEGNINVNPLFAYPQYDDFHLRSIAGRWDPNGGFWFSDNVTSPCIDAGDPNSDWTGELWPHGKRINMGAFGGTPEASMSRSTVGNIADFNQDDKVDSQDLQIYCEFWLDANLLAVPNSNRLGLTDFRDFCIFAYNWLWQE